ncbi:MAG TPA: pirin family protein [Oculatellaceae cyanobacterium]|jgi:redox-sensitive bicupin YhaK (pirin superfamily)
MHVRARNERGQTRTDWLESYHTFSFGDYQDSRHLQFSDLRVINDDIIQPGKGFDTHHHRDMEIITYVISGTLAHKDSLGNGSLIRPGDLQRMTAGTGIYHSEFNPSDTDPVHLLQIWLLPEQKGLSPSYQQTAFSQEERRGCWRLLASRDGRDNSITVHQDVSLYGTTLPVGAQLGFELAAERKAWIQMATGVAQLNGQILEAGDGAAIEAGETHILMEGLSRESEILLFDLRNT